MEPKRPLLPEYVITLTNDNLVVRADVAGCREDAIAIAMHFLQDVVGVEATLLHSYYEQFTSFDVNDYHVCVNRDTITASIDEWELTGKVSVDTNIQIVEI